VTLLFSTVLFLVALPAVATCAYLLLLTLLSAAQPRLPPSSRKLQFDIIIPGTDRFGRRCARVAAV
jgi:transcriptional regulator of nitric oxide reductase